MLVVSFKLDNTLDEFEDKNFFEALMQLGAYDIETEEISEKVVKHIGDGPKPLRPKRV